MPRALPNLATTVAFAAMVAALALATPAVANGNHAHESISLRAIDHLPTGPLRALLADPLLREALMNGTIFPDGGYVIGHGYGETAHWEPYQRALLHHLRKTHPQLENDAVARPKLAFLLGMFSHGMADQVYDALFMDTAKVLDKAGWSDELLSSFDTATDVFLVAQAGPSPIPLPWLPMQDILAVFAQRGEPVPEDTLSDAQATLTQAVLVFPKLKAQSAAGFDDLRQRYPWAWQHLLDPAEPGNPLCEARIVALYWQQVWDELHGAAPLVRVLATVPSEGGVHGWHQVGQPQSKLAVVLSRGIDQAKLATDALVVRNAKGQVLPATVNLFYGQNSNVIRLVPTQDWPVGQPLTLELKAGVAAYDGVLSAKGEVFKFSVGATSTQEPGLPPKGSPWQLASTLPNNPTPVMADKDAGGCGAGTTQPELPGWIFGLVAVVILGCVRRSFWS